MATRQVGEKKINHGRARQKPRRRTESNKQKHYRRQQDKVDERKALPLRCPTMAPSHMSIGLHMSEPCQHVRAYLARSPTRPGPTDQAAGAWPRRTGSPLLQGGTGVNTPRAPHERPFRPKRAPLQGTIAATTPYPRRIAIELDDGRTPNVAPPPTATPMTVDNRDPCRCKRFVS